MAEQFTVLIMAAGQGTRMRSSTPKVLHRICGRPMVEWVIASARDAGAGRVVCVVRPGDGVAEGLPDGVEVAEQREGEGTGAAVLAARASVESGDVLILSGDHPLVTPAHIAGLVAEQRTRSAAATTGRSSGSSRRSIRRASLPGSWPSARSTWAPMSFGPRPSTRPWTRSG